MEPVISILKEINIPQLISMAIMLWYGYSRLDKKIEKLSDKIEGVDKRLSNKIESLDEKLSDKIEYIDKKFSEKVDGVDKRLGHLDTRLAVIESKLSDISNNVSHLMWHHQALPSRDIEEK